MAAATFGLMKVLGLFRGGSDTLGFVLMVFGGSFAGYWLKDVLVEIDRRSIES